MLAIVQRNRRLLVIRILDYMMLHARHVAHNCRQNIMRIPFLKPPAALILCWRGSSIVTWYRKWNVHAILFRMRAFTRYCDGKRGASVQWARMNFEIHVSITPIMHHYHFKASRVLRTDSIFFLTSRDHRILEYLVHGYASNCQCKALSCII